MDDLNVGIILDDYPYIVTVEYFSSSALFFVEQSDDGVYRMVTGRKPKGHQPYIKEFLATCDGKFYISDVYSCNYTYRYDIRFASVSDYTRYRLIVL